MDSAPLLLIAYNRAEKLRNLIESLRPHKPKKLIISIDGPKLHKPDDPEKVTNVLKQLETINWTNDIELITYPENQGLKKAVTAAVTHGMHKHGNLIVLEEDVTVGKDFEVYANFMLEKYQNEEQIGHVSLYNVVSKTILSNRLSNSRLSIYPESVAWASWERAWKNFDMDMSWANEVSISELSKITGNIKSAIAWKFAFLDASSDRISTWAYRWIATMWSQNQLVISPNSNLVSYNGFDTGSHTLTKAPWQELPLEDINFNLDEVLEVDSAADRWLSEKVFRGSVSGLSKQLAVTAFRKFFKEKH